MGIIRRLREQKKISQQNESPEMIEQKRKSSEDDTRVYSVFSNADDIIEKQKEKRKDIFGGGANNIFGN